jgi:hypothetical protein
MSQLLLEGIQIMLSGAPPAVTQSQNFHNIIWLAVGLPFHFSSIITTVKYVLPQTVCCLFIFAFVFIFQTTF